MSYYSKFPALLMSSQPPVTAEYVSKAANAAPATSHTFSGVATGQNKPKKIVVVVLGDLTGSGTGTSAGSCSIGGAAASYDSNNSRTYGGISIFSRDVAGGTSHNISVNFANAQGCFIYVYAIYDLRLGVVDEAFKPIEDANPNTFSIAANPESNSVYIGFIKGSGAGALTSTWTGTLALSKNVEEKYSGNIGGSAAMRVFTDAASGTMAGSISLSLGQAASIVGYK